MSEPGAGMPWWQSFGAAVNHLVAAATNGYTVSAEGGRALLDAIDTLHAKISRHLIQSGELGQVALQLGSSPAANTYKPFLHSVLTNADQGMIPALTLLRRDLERAHDAIQKNMADYQRTEAENAATMGVRDSGR